MLTGPVRANARKDGAIGCLAAFAAAVLVYGAWANLDALTSILEAIGYIGTVLFIAVGLLIGAVILVRYWMDTERDCDEIDRRTAEIDGAYHITEDGEIVPGKLRRYEHDAIYDEWEDANGFRRVLVRKLTAAEKREIEIQNGDGGGYGSINYGG